MEMTLERAVRLVSWASGGTVKHPTSTCRVYSTGLFTVRNPEPDCTCGLWEAIEFLRSHPFGKLVMEGGKPL